MTRLSTKGGACLSLAAIVMLWAPVTASAADATFTDRIIVKYRGGGAVSGLLQGQQKNATDASAARHGVALNRVRTTALGSQVLQVDRRLSLDEATRLAADIAASDPNVEYAEPDRIMRRTLTPNDTRYNEQWHYFESTGGINAPAAWDKTTGAGVVVAVIAITKGQRRIPTQSAKHVRGRRVYGGTRQFLPLRVNQAGVMPVIFASSLLVIPAFLFKWLAGAFNWRWAYTLEASFER